MKNALIALCLLVLLMPVADANPYLKTFPAGGVLRFALQDHIQHPAFWWPRTLLTYPVDFSGADVPEGGLALLDGAHHPVPFQLSAVRTQHGKLRFARVSFFSDLPSGGTRLFELRRAVPPQAAPTSEVQSHSVNGVVEVDTGALSVRLPASRVFKFGARVPGPILGLRRAGGWIGDSTLVSPGKRVLHVETTLLDRGPLFQTWRVAYTFACGARYAATVRAVAGYDFLELFEESRGLAKADDAFWETAWTHFAPTVRSAPFGPDWPVDKPRVLAFRGEDPAFTGPGRTEEPEHDYFNSLVPFSADGTIGNSEAHFLDARSGEGLGVFVLNPAAWQDHEYSIWASSSTLAVHFRHEHGTLRWRWPLVTGTRETGLTLFGPNARARQNGLAMSHENFLANRYGFISLNRVKDWVLEYPDAARRLPISIPDSNEESKSVGAYWKALWTSPLLDIATRNLVHPVTMRAMSRWVVPGFAQFRDALTPAQRERATALLLFTSYVASQEEASPLRNLLGGHPNFMADWKYPLPAGAALFPDHPLAGEWCDQFEKFLELAGIFYVRPDVPAWGAQGGRWTESIGIYNWAFLEPAARGNALAMQFDGRNRFAQSGLALHGEYLTGILTAPVTQPARTLRLHPPQGAHAGQRGAEWPMYALGRGLRRFRPLDAEALMWGGAANARLGDGESLDPGTDPHLQSEKFTGYGLVLRAAVDTPDEVAVFLQQIDKGPNYRWGFGNEGGCGDIYFYARSASFSGHLGEDAGDRRVSDGDFTSNTAAYKDKTFRAVGMNDLTRPFYPLDVAQFAELTPRRTDPYSWPEYHSRCVMLVGSDYFLVGDSFERGVMSRFNWNTVVGEDALPTIIPIRGENAWVMDRTTRGKGGATATRGVTYDPYKAGGDRLMLVTHRSDVRVLPRKRGDLTPFTTVETAQSEDFVFQNQNAILEDSAQVTFHGTAGVLRRFHDGHRALALFHGSQIGDDQLTLSVSDPNQGVSAVYTASDTIAGQSLGAGTLTLTFHSAPPAASFYLDGARVASQVTGSGVHVALPPGLHRWEWTVGLPEPMPPVMLRTEDHPGGARLFFTTAPGADNYRLETSADGGKIWQVAGETTVGEFDLTGQTNGTKIAVRAVALNARRESRPAREYPVYVTDAPPLPPDGLKLRLGRRQVGVTWGEVLGASEYRLYRRVQGRAAWREVYRGAAREFTDTGLNAVPAFAAPGLAANAERLRKPTIYEYAVAAVSGNGEGPQSLPENSDPASWRNWYPEAPLRFKRRSAYWQPPYVLPDQMPPVYYPEGTTHGK